MLPKGPLAIRFIAGMRAESKSTAKISMQLTSIDGSRRDVLLKALDMPTAKSGEIFIGVIEIPSAADDRIGQIELEWACKEDLFVVDFAVIRP